MTDKKPKGRNDVHQMDYSRIIDHVIVGSNLCMGRDCKDHAKEFQGLGVSVEINMDDQKREIPPDDLDGYLWLPVVDGYAPDNAQLDMGTALINQTVNNGKTVYVHCKNGHGRSPTLVIAYLMKYKQMDYDTAHSLVKGKRSEIHIEEEQTKALKEYSRQ